MELMHTEGTRAELVAQLREMSEGWSHLCKESLSIAAADAANGLEAGSFSVKVGHTTYSVTDDQA